MIAYQQVARTVGVSAAWLRKFVADHDTAREPRWSVGQKIINQYLAVCARIEADMSLRNQAAQVYQRQRNAVVESMSRLDQSLSQRMENAARVAQGHDETDG